MTSRKKPQQELACYLDELLTELEEPSGQQSVNKVASDSVNLYKEAGALSPKNIDESKPDTPVASASKASTPKVSTPTVSVTKRPLPGVNEAVVHKPAVNKVKVNATTVETTTEAAKQVNIDRTQIHVTHQASLQIRPQMSPQEKISRATDSDIDLRQREKERLKRLLNSLPPTLELPSVEVEPKKEAPPADTIVVKVKTRTMSSHEIASPDLKSPSKPSQQQVDTAPANIDVAAVSVPSVEIESASEVTSILDTHTAHQWQPLGHEWQANGRPAWAENPFDVLLVDVQGIQLAMPLASLDGIYPLKEELTPLFGQSEWFMGLQKIISGNVNVINTAQFIMPERYVKSDEMTAQYSVAINGSGWALAVDAIHQPMIVNPDDIRWRKRRSERPWMAGTIKNHVCALIDIPSLANMFKQQDKNG
ncbi:MAG: purine-binding chemotaxis protein CheW [Candidatus Endobugula sp.]|jgi:purine-binding chemotaxis protein CheW